MECAIERTAPMIRTILGSMGIILIGLISAVFGFVMVVNLGFMIAREFSYGSREGNEATRPIGIVLGALMGMFITWKVIFGERSKT